MTMNSITNTVLELAINGAPGASRRLPNMPISPSVSDVALSLRYKPFDASSPVFAQVVGSMALGSESLKVNLDVSDSSVWKLNSIEPRTGFEQASSLTPLDLFAALSHGMPGAVFTGETVLEKVNLEIITAQTSIRSTILTILHPQITLRNGTVLKQARMEFSHSKPPNETGVSKVDIRALLVVTGVDVPVHGTVPTKNLDRFAIIELDGRSYVVPDELECPRDSVWDLCGVVQDFC